MIWFTQGPASASAFRRVVLCAALLASATAAARVAAQTHTPAAGGAASGKHAGVLPGQKTFTTAQDAIQAFVAAIEHGDDQAMLGILGPDAQEIVSSGDAVADRQEREQFLDKYKQMHRLLTEPDGLTTLYVGAENWPLPIPLARQAGAWYFDAAGAQQEILYRRIGHNELTVIDICGELVAAEKEYDASPHDGAAQKEYAQKIVSSSGQHDGLYWPAAASAPQSPLGPLIAAAEQAGYSQGASPRKTPFYGYYFRILKGQGANAPGGAESYLAGGAMTRGFAFVAYPAEYRSSGVLTFLVGPDGVVYQKDLGKNTEAVAGAMKLYDPDPGWQQAN